MRVDYDEMMWAEVDDIGLLLHEISDAEFDEPSLCEGWNVRDVIGHMCFGHTTPMPTILVTIAKYRGNMTKGSFEKSKEFAAARTPAELRAIWDVELKTNRSRKGIAKVIKSREAFLDHLIHNQDIRRPVGRSRNIPEARLTAAMQLLPTIKTPFFSTKPTVQGLRLVATDIDHAVGDGPEICGPAEALILAAAGRSAAFDDLTGEGMSSLTERVVNA